MGTNYYWTKEVKPACECCGRDAEVKELHIGKSSAGWCFSIHVMPEDGINSLDDWIALFNQEGSCIKDEYDRIVTAKEILSKIKERGRNDKNTWDHEMMRMNGAEHGPNNLVRHKISRHCIGHGDGTWNYIVGDFS